VEYISKDQFQQWYDGNGLRNIMITSRNGNSWRGFASVPADAAAQ
jgi:hypothetical protein